MPSLLQIELAKPDDDPEIRAILRDNPMSGAIHTTLEREPNVFVGEAISGDLNKILVARDTHKNTLVGCASYHEYDVYVNGEITRISYISGLRIAEGFKGRHRFMLEAYDQMRQLHQSGDAKYSITTIISDNVNARRLLEAGLKGMPKYEPLQKIETLVIPVKKAARPDPVGQGVSQAKPEHLSVIAEHLQKYGRNFQFHSVWTKDALLSSTRSRGLRPKDFFLQWERGQLAGCLALWDQREFKQSVVRGYERKIAYGRPFFNLIAPLIKQPRLPAPGKELNAAFLSHVAVALDVPERLVCLIQSACGEALNRGLDYIMIGFVESHPFLKKIKEVFQFYSYQSILYRVHWDDHQDKELILDQRRAHLEAAIL